MYENAQLKTQQQRMQQQIANMKTTIQAQQRLAKEDRIQKLRMQQKICSLQYDLQIQTLQDTPTPLMVSFEMPVLPSPKLKERPIIETACKQNPNWNFASSPLPSPVPTPFDERNIPMYASRPDPEQKRPTLPLPVCLFEKHNA